MACFAAQNFNAPLDAAGRQSFDPTSRSSLFEVLTKQSEVNANG
jgi:hypothetical protein